MHNKKTMIKKNIIGFIVALLLCTSLGVYAAVTFPSSDITYDNTQSGLQSTTVKGAIDELYTECTTVPAGEQIIEDAELEKDPYECRYFFTGANPNNYITFNNEKAGWRILSVECDGTIKIMKINNIGDMAWDSSSSSNWSRPSSLNAYLNVTYYNSLNSTAQSQIVAKDWSIGAVTYGNYNLATQINNENSTKWDGKVALVTISEYIRSNSNKSSCDSISLNNSNYSICVSTGWMNTTTVSYWWTLSPTTRSSYDAFFVYSTGVVAYSSVQGNRAVRPTLYLSSDIKITGGTGTSSDPYEISL